MMLTYWEMLAVDDTPNVVATWYFTLEPLGAYDRVEVERDGRREVWWPVPSPSWWYDQPNFQRVT
jgi:hypothetical protein